MVEEKISTADLLLQVPSVMTELGAEFVRRGHECMLASPESQFSACFLLVIRALSLLGGMGALLKPNVRDSFDVLARAFTESRDLLMTFRFDDQGTRGKIQKWFAGKQEWNADYKRVNAFLKELSGNDAELAKRFGLQSSVSHPTVQAAKNSTHIALAWIAPGKGEQAKESNEQKMKPKIDDYLVCVGTLIVAATVEAPGWISLGCDDARMPHVEPFRLQAAALLHDHR
jgi:hypothetical protein